MTVNSEIKTTLSMKEVAMICAALLQRNRPDEAKLAERLAAELYDTSGPSHPLMNGEEILYSKQVPHMESSMDVILSFIEWLGSVDIPYSLSDHGSYMFNLETGDMLKARPGQIILVSGTKGVGVVDDYGDGSQF